MNAGGHTREHFLRDIQSREPNARILLQQNPGKSAFTAPNVQHLLIGKRPKIL